MGQRGDTYLYNNPLTLQGVAPEMVRLSMLSSDLARCRLGKNIYSFEENSLWMSIHQQ
jgi:hypothetical protein